jgi:N-methylhydantoinase B
LAFEFAGTDPAVAGNLNAVPAITVSAAAYCLRCLSVAILGVQLPMNQGAISPLSVYIPEGSLLNPRRPYAVAAGNVETSQRVVDVIFGALAQALPDLVPAASQGTMNNLTFGRRQNAYSDQANVPDSYFAYYETIGGGAGAGPNGSGGRGLHVHMSNTRNTPVEALEYAFPLQVKRYALRPGSGGAGLHQGGDGLVREIQFQAPVRLTVVSERRRRPPYGLQGGQRGALGRNTVRHAGHESPLPGNATVDLEPGDSICIETPGGGGWGEPPQ